MSDETQVAIRAAVHHQILATALPKGTDRNRVATLAIELFDRVLAEEGLDPDTAADMEARKAALNREVFGEVKR